MCTPALLPPRPDESRLNLYKVTEERDQLKKEKEEQHQSLMRKMKEVEMAYEAILQVSSLLCVLGSEVIMNVGTLNITDSMNQDVVRFYQLFSSFDLLPNQFASCPEAM